MSTGQSYLGKGDSTTLTEPTAYLILRTASKANKPTPLPDQRQTEITPHPLTSDPADPNEIWRPFPYYEQRYQVSNKGRVRTADGQIMLPFTHPWGFECVLLSKQNSKKVRAMAICYAVAKAFLPNPGFLFVRHIDGNTKNNQASNLEWTTIQPAAPNSSSLTSFNPSQS